MLFLWHPMYWKNLVHQKLNEQEELLENGHPDVHDCHYDQDCCCRARSCSCENAKLRIRPKSQQLAKT